MFIIEVLGVESLLAKFDAYIADLDALKKVEMPKELEAWQREDMHRRYPNTEIEGAGNEDTVSTQIWPRSRLSEQKKRRGPAVAAPKVHRPAQHAPNARVPSSRPILRPELEKTLFERMVKLVSETMKWRST